MFRFGIWAFLKKCATESFFSGILSWERFGLSVLDRFRQSFHQWPKPFVKDSATAQEVLCEINLLQ